MTIESRAVDFDGAVERTGTSLPSSIYVQPQLRCGLDIIYGAVKDERSVEGEHGSEDCRDHDDDE